MSTVPVIIMNPKKTWLHIEVHGYSIRSRFKWWNSCANLAYNQKQHSICYANAKPSATRHCGKVTNQMMGRGSLSTQLRRHPLAENDAKGPGDPIRKWKVIRTEKIRSAPIVVRLVGMERFETGRRKEWFSRCDLGRGTGLKQTTDLEDDQRKGCGC